MEVLEAWESESFEGLDDTDLWYSLSWDSIFFTVVDNWFSADCRSDSIDAN